MDNTKEYYTIDLLHIVKSLGRRAWLIALVGLLAAAIGFSVASFVIAPTYSSSIMLYVNNSSISVGGASFSISSSQITAAQSLVKTYSEILYTRETLEEVIEKSGVDYSYGQLRGMISAAPANETEIMKVTVVAEDPYDAAKIASCISEVLPIRIDKIIDGATMEVVESAIPNPHKIGPSITKYTAVGLALGILLAVVAVAVAAMMDDTIHDEEYVLRTFDCPILAKVPDLINSGSKRYGYYYRKHGYEYASKDVKKEVETGASVEKKTPPHIVP